MGNNCYKPIQINGKKITHISNAVDESLEYIDGRRSGKIVSLKTRWDKFNSICMGGIEPNTIYTVAGISGSGKSAFANMLETDILDLNKEHDIIVLSFTFEMLSSRQVGRKLSNKLKRSTKSMYSVDYQVSDSDFQVITNSTFAFRNYPIYYVDDPCTPDEIENIIIEFQNGIAKDKWLIVILDHTLLSELSMRETEQEMLTKLQKKFIKIKKAKRTTLSIIQLSQMNRDIEKIERVNNPALHYPMRSDISTSDKVYQASDYVIVIHRPEILGIVNYGRNAIPAEGMVFLHLIKNREGDVGVIAFKNRLEHNELSQV